MKAQGVFFAQIHTYQLSDTGAASRVIAMGRGGGGGGSRQAAEMGWGGMG